MTPIAVQNLDYAYRGSGTLALDGLTFDVEPGEIFGFLGPSGAGKTTTQKILTGLLDEYDGTATVLDRPVENWGPELYRHVGVSSESPNLYLKLTGRENLELFTSLYGGAKRDPLDLLERVGIRDAFDQRVGTYSKGMRMRLNFVRALLHEPELVFLDEPTGGIDPTNARAIMEVVEDLRASGTTVFLTTHDMTVADRLCDRVAFIVDGRIPVIDAPQDLKLEYGSPAVRVGVRGDGSLTHREFSLRNLGADAEFRRLLDGNRIETIHSEEATLADVFVAVTGEVLA